ncbi:uncharacterized protein ARB_05959 [Trichophyton benhamiae CBS 112371]|uniref:Uncharacterized protein n=2 Tax=Trichophyton TaxID=5550 RepID=D4ANZ2_ARTBC|nr:uncharacterized protein ARB_05959 [Trichophyton benhamiae CBS 112371]XP_003018515.1 uncharacterized protein TRV_07461 [Trichophyton verrucosum HKI 0517]EFE35003.1 hypothetical protein ARB_05959 [Trichophyton benhamiae CBS 112371]EFE37870.1 hypothetical protein TRV_07461 [Trichophyton verrucosum HKI 0517]
MPFIEGMYSGFAFSLFLFLMTNPLRWYLIQKKKNKIICKKWKTADICTRLSSPFLFLHENERGIKLSGRSRGLLVGVLGGLAHPLEVLCQGFYGVGGGTRLDGLWVVCKEEGHLSPDDDDAGFPLRCCKYTEFGVKEVNAYKLAVDSAVIGPESEELLSADVEAVGLSNETDRQTAKPVRKKAYFETRRGSPCAGAILVENSGLVDVAGANKAAESKVLDIDQGDAGAQVPAVNVCCRRQLAGLYTHTRRRKQPAADIPCQDMMLGDAYLCAKQSSVCERLSSADSCCAVCGAKDEAGDVEVVAAAVTSADRIDGWLAASPGLEQSSRPSFSSSGGGGGGGTGSPAIFNQTPRIPRPDNKKRRQMQGLISSGSEMQRRPITPQRGVAAAAATQKQHRSSTEANRSISNLQLQLFKYGQDGIEMNRERRRRYAHHG